MHLLWKNRMQFFICFLLMMICEIYGCEHNVTETDPQTRNELSFTKVLNDVFVSCTACHLDGATSGGLDLSDYNNIVNVKSTQRNDLMLINPKNLDSSYLYMKLIGAEGIIGSPMPLGGQLSEDQLALLRDWIEVGAPERASE